MGVLFFCFVFDPLFVVSIELNDGVDEFFKTGLSDFSGECLNCLFERGLNYEAR